MRILFASWHLCHRLTCHLMKSISAAHFFVLLSNKHVQLGTLESVTHYFRSRAEETDVAEIIDRLRMPDACECRARRCAK